MNGTPLSRTSLPRATALTQALISPSDRLVTRDDITERRKRLEEGFRSVGGHRIANAPLIVDAYRLREPISIQNKGASAFRWTPSTSRRQVGLEGVRTWLANRRLTPAQASQDAIARLVRHSGQSGEPSSSLAQWLAGLSIGARSVVQAEATTWATQFISALDWSNLEHPIVGGDRTVAFGSDPPVRLRGRIELQTAVPTLHSATSSNGDESPVSVFTIMTGRPTQSARVELGLAALTIALQPRHTSTPVRVVGWWPQCGRALLVPVDVDLLDKTCSAVIEAVASVHRNVDPVPMRSIAKIARARNASSAYARLAGHAKAERVAS
jgi:hypothetical protein